MLQRMEAEILFLNPDHVNFGIAVLTEHDFDVEILDWIDDCGPTVLDQSPVASDMVSLWP